MSNIFEEAIADAKKLKQVAEENAKKAIMESVTPQIREFIEEQLLEEREEETTDEETSDEENESLEEEVYLDESALSSLAGIIGINNLDSINESKSKKALISAVKGAVASMSENDREQLLNLSHKINESANNLSRKKGENDMSRKYYEVDLRTLRESLEAEDESAMYEDEDLMSELSRLLEQDDEAPEGDSEDDAMAPPPAEDDSLDMGDMDMGGAAVGAAAGGESFTKEQIEDAIMSMLGDLGIDPAELSGDAGGAPAGGAAPFDLEMESEEEPPSEEEPAEGEEEEKLDEVIDIDPVMLREELARMKRVIREAKDAKQSKVAHHFGGKGSSKADHKHSFGGSGPKKLGHKHAFGGGDEGKDVFVSPPQLNKLNEAIRELRRQNRAQTEKLEKYRGAVNSLREQLEELNLFNAKLLYVNKLLQNKSLNESQKKSVIKALDEAKSLQEAKSLYSSLTETLSRSDNKGTLSESRVLGSSSRATTSSQTTTTMTSSNELSRWQKLAGL